MINDILALLSTKYPNPSTELEYENHFTLLVAVLLSAQSKDQMVNKATKELFHKYNTPEAILTLGYDGLIEYIKIIGLYRTKGKNIIKLSEILIDKYQSKVPDQFAELIKLPGVGRKTADVVLNVCFNKPTIPVDTHIFRVSNRIGISKGKNANQVADDLIKIIPTKWKKDAHHVLVLHGRYICTAKKPQCSNCPINHLCKKIGIK